MDRGIGRFTLEYPVNYEISKVEVKEELGYTLVTIIEKYWGEDRFNTSTDVFINESDDGEPDPEASLEQALKWARDSRDFKLLDRSPVTVSGIQGEQIIYFCNRPPTDYEARRGMGWKPSINRKLYFAYGESVWSLRLMYQQTTDTADESYEADFEHILETFQILE